MRKVLEVIILMVSVSLQKFIFSRKFFLTALTQSSSNVREEQAEGRWYSQAFSSSTACCSAGLGVRPDEEEARISSDVENVWKLEGTHATQIK